MSKKLHVGSLDQVKGFKNISLDLTTYGKIFDLSQNNPLHVDLSVAKTIKYLLQYYIDNAANKNQKVLLNEAVENAKVQKTKKHSRIKLNKNTVSPFLFSYY